MTQGFEDHYTSIENGKRSKLAGFGAFATTSALLLIYYWKHQLNFLFMLNLWVKKQMYIRFFSVCVQKLNIKIVRYGASEVCGKGGLSCASLAT